MGNAVATAQVDEAVCIEPRPRAELHLGSLQAAKKRILFVTSELADLVKVGGLGDVSAALPKALSAHHDMRVLLPGYRQVLESGYPIRMIGQVNGLAALPPCRIGRMDLPDGLIVYLLICPELYEREGTPYGDGHGHDWPDNHIRFARLGLAAAQIADGTACISWCPELVHANDWPAALASAYMAWHGVNTPRVFTIHNLAYQGLCDLQCSAELGIPAEALTSEALEFYGKLSFLKGGIAYSNHVTTVSETYAQEITTPLFGCGLEGMLQAKVNNGQLSGIINGIDESWEPRSDPHLVEGFSAGRWQGKEANARHVRERFQLEMHDGPLFAVISRLVQQKGIDLTHDVAGHIVEAGGSIVVIGQGEPDLEQAMVDLGESYPGRIGVSIGFDETVARRMFAGSDFLLMPSRFEPCGLSQMYAQCFGSLPIAHRTGGLADTIEDGVTGFHFEDETVDSYRDAIDRALAVYRHPELLDAMRVHAMDSPLYWGRTIWPYDELYQRLVDSQCEAGDAL
ncbi:glycogen synthase GlgA [Pseudomonas sp. BN414]|uniref:glycogen synthase GlgA n=1 Tax=Pseudomonas sp. BN414 TaxID=2567888 RepID=UPI002458F1C7|nr:glycogen synthase GlgA [Pseudomonas sp. BN414]MDH4567579.1 glycogen synthase GlgA [Pseudomonas sp. BN414]